MGLKADTNIGQKDTRSSTAKLKARRPAWCFASMSPRPRFAPTTCCVCGATKAALLLCLLHSLLCLVSLDLNTNGCCGRSGSSWFCTTTFRRLCAKNQLKLYFAVFFLFLSPPLVLLDWNKIGTKQFDAVPLRLAAVSAAAMRIVPQCHDRFVALPSTSECGTPLSSQGTLQHDRHATLRW